MNTPIQEAISQIKEKIKLFDGKDDLDLTLRERGMLDAYINSVKVLESLLSKEQEYLLDFGVECQLELYRNESLIVKAFEKAVDVFNDIYINK